MIRMILSLLMMVALQSRQGWPSRESSLYCVRLSGCSMGLACRWYSCGASVEIQWSLTLRKRRTLHQRWGDTVRSCLIVRTTRRRDLIERDREVLQRSIAPAHSTSRTVLERSHGKAGLCSSEKGRARLEAEDQWTERCHAASVGRGKISIRRVDDWGTILIMRELPVRAQSFRQWIYSLHRDRDL